MPFFALAEGSLSTGQLLMGYRLGEARDVRCAILSFTPGLRRCPVIIIVTIASTPCALIVHLHIHIVTVNAVSTAAD